MLSKKATQVRDIAFDKAKEYAAFIHPRKIICITGLPNQVEDEYLFAAVESYTSAKPNQYLYDSEFTIRIIDNLLNDSRVLTKEGFETSLGKIDPIMLTIPFESKINFFMINSVI